MNLTSLNLTPHPDDCRSAASYVAAGLQLATRRGAPPPPGRGSPDAWHRVGDVSADAIRACVELASRPASNGRCFELVDDVAEAWATEGHTNPTQGADVEARTRDVRVANSALRRWSIATSCALALVRCQASGAIPPDVEWDALDAISVGTNASSSAGAFALLASARARSDPGIASTRVAATMRAPLAKRAPAIATLVAERVAELYALGGGFGVGSNKTGVGSIRAFAARARELAVAVHDAFRGFKSIAPTTWQRSLDASATHPAFQVPFLAVLGFLRGVPLLSPGGVDDVSPALAAIDALARLEFARTPDPRYVTLLRDVANALASDDDGPRDWRERRARRSSRIPSPSSTPFSAGASRGATTTRWDPGRTCS